MLLKTGKFKKFQKMLRENWGKLLNFEGNKWLEVSEKTLESNQLVFDPYGFPEPEVVVDTVAAWWHLWLLTQTTIGQLREVNQHHHCSSTIQISWIKHIIWVMSCIRSSGDSVVGQFSLVVLLPDHSFGSSAWTKTPKGTAATPPTGQFLLLDHLILPRRRCWSRWVAAGLSNPNSIISCCWFDSMFATFWPTCFSQCAWLLNSSCIFIWFWIHACICSFCCCCDRREDPSRAGNDVPRLAKLSSWSWLMVSAQ